MNKSTQHSISSFRQTASLRRGPLVAIAVIALTLLFALTHSGKDWRSSSELHTLMASLGALLALIAGVLAIMRHRTRPSMRFLFFGAALIGAGLIDGGHALITSNVFEVHRISDLQELAPWSWTTSRFYFATLILAALLFERWSSSLSRRQIVINESLVVLGAAAFFVSCAVVFLTVPLPSGQFEVLAISRPQEIIPGSTLLIALVLVLLRPSPFDDPFETWFAVSLVCGVFAHFLFMAFSDELFDASFDLALLLTVASYAAILAGLLLSTYRVFLLERTRAEQNAALSDDLQRHVRLTYHDLREPLRGILNLADWIEEDSGEDLPDSARRNLTLIRKQARRLEDLVIGFRDYAEAGMPDSSPDVIDSARIIRDTFAALHRDGGFTLSLAARLPAIWSRKGGFDVVVRRILENAIKHHDRGGGTIHVDVRQFQDGHEFRISDDGPGIAANDRAAAFEAYRTLQAKDVREGAGVGLAIARKIVEGAGGAIGIAETEGTSARGTTVWFRWPSRPADLAPRTEVWSEPRHVAAAANDSQNAA
ncbi:sensor histidine kinase [Nisaea sp.]|uniref:sensor histidine kinase n=1 Tax=Nisaea sp. TaxID=2024842 RepID=UPI003B515B7C